MWDDRLNDYLDDPSKPPSEDVKEQYARYRYVLEVYAASVSYKPSSKLKEDFLKKIRRKRRFKKTFKYALIFGSIAIAMMSLKILQSPKSSDIQEMSQIMDTIQIVRTVGDGF